MPLRRTSRRSPNPSDRRPVLGVESLEGRAVPAVVAPAAVSVAEGQGKPVTFKLNKAPTADVTFAIASSNTAEATIDKASLTFTPANWKTPQVVVVSAIEDGRLDGNRKLQITVGPVTSDDPKYNAATVKNIAVSTLDSKKIDPALYQGNFSGSFSGSKASGSIVATVTGSAYDVVVTVENGPAGYEGATGSGSGTIRPDGSVTVRVSLDIGATVTYSGKIQFAKDGSVSFKGKWNLGPAAGTWLVTPAPLIG